MSKIICDVCGTSYQESSAHCPICGCARPVDVVPEITSDETKIVRRENYTYVKGGRFSKANVQKRHNGVLRENSTKSASSNKSSNPMNNKGDRGLVIAVCALLLAIIAVVIYIAVHFFSGSERDNYEPPVMQETTTQSTETTAVSDISCTGIVLSQSELTFTYVGEAYTLRAALTPDDTTDELLFSTSDDTIATVSDSGNVVAVAAGEVVITVTCGDASAQCHVVCDFTEDSTEVATEPTVDTNVYTAPYKINKKDVSISVGETFQLKLTDATGQIIPVTWSPAVADICAIDDNLITGKMKGKVEITTTYDGEIYTCIVRVR